MDLFLKNTQLSLHTALIDGMEWSGVDYLWISVMFLSAVWTFIMTVPIHWRGSIAAHVM